MAKRQRLSSYQLDDLPDEVILKILDFSDLKERLLCGQVSKRLQAISNDESLWLKLNMRGRKIPYDFIEKVIGNGCQYLSLPNCDILDFTGKSESSFNLKYLNVSNQDSLSDGLQQGVKKLVQNCSSLQKLSVSGLKLDSDDIQYICQNSKTLQVLDLEGCKFDLHKLKESQIGQTWEDLKLEYCNFRTKSIQDLLKNCAHLTELNFCVHNDNENVDWLLDPQIQALVDNLTPTILKVALGFHKNFQDEHVKKLVKRCNKITHLYLTSPRITNNSVHNIIEQLKASLEKLDVSHSNLDFATLLQLKSMPALKALIFGSSKDGHAEVIENLKQKLRCISINEDQFFYYIACPFKPIDRGGADMVR